jgi:hypothetical protein
MDDLTLRALERLTAVAIGGLAIYLGYRLFMAADLRPHPRAGDLGSATMSLPGKITLAVTRVGPGVFFALFGTLVVGGSFLHPMTITNRIERETVGDGTAPQDGTQGTVRYFEERSIVGLNPGQARDATAGRPADPESAVGTGERQLERLRVRHDIGVLNALPARLDPDLPAADRARIAEALRRVRLALMAGVWIEDWGDPAAFARWTDGGPPPADAAAFAAARRFFEWDGDAE